MDYQRSRNLVDLKIQGNGLSKGTQLISEQEGYEWIVIGRLIFNHTSDKQIRFNNETEIPMQLVIKSKEKEQVSKKGLIDNENQGIFQYVIKPTGHNEKPKQFEKLKIL